MRRLISSQKGAGMYLAMAATAALGAAGFLMGDLFINAEEVIKKDSRIVGYQLLVDTVRKNLYAGNNCSLSLASAPPSGMTSLRSGVTLPIGGIPIDTVNLTNALDNEAGVAPMLRGVELKGLPLKLVDSALTLEPGWKAKTGTGIKSMRIILENPVKLPAPYTGTRIIRYPTDPSNPMSPLKNLTASEMYLVIEPDHKGVNVWAPENKKYWIKLYAYIDAATKEIHSCYDPTSEAIFCTETMKGAYVNDPAIPASSRCRPDMGCFTYMSGLISTSIACPDDDYSDYRENRVSSNYKTCTWCPPTPYNLPALVQAVGVDNPVFDLSDADALDCSAANPYAGLSEREAWENYSYYVHLRSQLPPDQYAPYAGCLDHNVPCYDYPETCSNNCGGPSTCSCATDVPDDPGTCYNECTGDNSACGTASPDPDPVPCVDDPNTCQNECTGDRSACPCVDDPNTCQNECTGDRSTCPTCVDDPDTECYNECTRRARRFCEEREFRYR